MAVNSTINLLAHDYVSEYNLMRNIQFFLNNGIIIKTPSGKCATGPCIANPLRDVNTICRRSWYISADIWKIYDFKIKVVPSINNSRFAECLPLIYPPELEVKETTDTASSASFLDLYLESNDSDQ
jgi:hypothetical protein